MPALLSTLSSRSLTQRTDESIRLSTDKLQYHVSLDTLLALNPPPAFPPRTGRVRHQAPTLIGCELLKIVRLARRAIPSSAARFALLRQQQRSEIMQLLTRLVNGFLALP
jgi:hypothetical protein